MCVARLPGQGEGMSRWLSKDVYEALGKVITNLPPAKDVRGLVLKLAPMDAPTVTIELFPEVYGGDPVIQQFALVTEDEYQEIQSLPTEEN